MHVRSFIINIESCLLKKKIILHYCDKLHRLKSSSAHALEFKFNKHFDKNENNKAFWKKKCYSAFRCPQHQKFGGEILLVHLVTVCWTRTYLTQCLKTPAKSSPTALTVNYYYRSVRVTHRCPGISCFRHVFNKTNPCTRALFLHNPILMVVLFKQLQSF